MECTNIVGPHQLLCHWFTVVFVLFCIYTPDDLFSRPIVNQSGGLFWKIRTPVANTGKSRSIGQMPVVLINFLCDVPTN